MKNTLLKERLELTRSITGMIEIMRIQSSILEENVEVNQIEDKVNSNKNKESDEKFRLSGDYWDLVYL